MQFSVPNLVSQALFPVACDPNNAFTLPCTINSGTSYTQSYSNIDQIGMTLIYNGNAYILAPG